MTKDDCREAFEEWYSKQETLSSIKPASWRAYQAGRASSSCPSPEVQALLKSGLELQDWLAKSTEAGPFTSGPSKEAKLFSAFFADIAALQAALKGRG